MMDMMRKRKEGGIVEKKGTYLVVAMDPQNHKTIAKSLQTIRKSQRWGEGVRTSTVSKKRGILDQKSLPSQKDGYLGCYHGPYMVIWCVGPPRCAVDS